MADSELLLVPSPINGVIPPVAHRFVKGRSGRPPGMPPVPREYLDGYGKKVEAKLRRIFEDKNKSMAQREAAGHHLLILQLQQEGRAKEANDLYRTVCGDAAKHIEHSLTRKIEIIERQIFGREDDDE